MGEAVYYMMAEFATADEANEKVEKIQAFLERMAEAEDKWQSTRGGGREAYLARREEFKDIYDALGIDLLASEKPDYSNDEAGQLDSPFREDGGQVWVEGARIAFSGNIWHMADWSGLDRAMQKTFGAIRSECTSEEESGENFDSLRIRLDAPKIKAAQDFIREIAQREDVPQDLRDRARAAIE